MRDAAIKAGIDQLRQRESTDKWVKWGFVIFLIALCVILGVAKYGVFRWWVRSIAREVVVEELEKRGLIPKVDK